MNYEIVITDQAEKDLQEIYDYIAYELMAPANADSQLNRLELGMNELCRIPNKGRPYNRQPWKSRGLRIIPIDNYVVLYIPKPDEKIVNIIRVMYAGRDVDAQMGKFTKL